MKVPHELCEMCVYYPPNLPAQAYSKEDYAMLQAKQCSYDLQPASPSCLQTHKTSCSLVDMNTLPAPS